MGGEGTTRPRWGLATKRGGARWELGVGEVGSGRTQHSNLTQELPKTSEFEATGAPLPTHAPQEGRCSGDKAAFTLFLADWAAASRPNSPPLPLNHPF